MRLVTVSRRVGWAALGLVVIVTFAGCPLSGGLYTPVGKWRVVYDWGCDDAQKASTTFRVFENGTFTDTFGAGSHGTWDGTQNRVTFYYDNGAVYAGVINTETNMTGTMEQFDAEGCWSAGRTSETP